MKLAKRISAICVSILLLLLFSSPVSALSISGTDAPQEIGVYAKSIESSSTENTGKAVFSNGRSTITINGVTFNFEASVADGTTVTVIYISPNEKAPYNWIKDSVSTGSTMIMPFYVYFSNGDIITEPSFEVSIAVGNVKGTADKLYYLSTIGDSKILSSSLGSTITLSSQKSGYYVISIKDSYKDDKGVPDTGDNNTNLIVPIVLMLLSTITIVFLVIANKGTIPAVSERSDKEDE